MSEFIFAFGAPLAVFLRYWLQKENFRKRTRGL